MSSQKTLHLVLLSLVAVSSVLCAWLIGDVAIPINSLFHANHSIYHQILFQIRLPRVANAFICGAMLGLCGALMQTLLRNPLADPYLFGISGGAGTAYLCAILWGASAVWLKFWTFSGALLSMLIVFLLAYSKSHWSNIRLLLLGIIMTCLYNAIMTFILVLSPNNTIHGMLFWLAGDLTANSLPLLPGLLLIILLIYSLLRARSLNCLLHGQLKASTLGVNIKQLQIELYLITSILTANCVMIAGTVGFVGLLIPHIIRLTVGCDHRYVLPASVLLGGSFLTLADLLARVVEKPQILPVGIFTALLGIPILMILLYQRSKQVLGYE